MSPRAAWRLEHLGFDQVYDYTAGKVDWLAAGLRVEGDRPPSVIDAIDRDVPTCGPANIIAEVVERTRTAGWDVCVVVNEHAIVQGRLRLDRVDADSHDPVETVMEPGPVTVRAHDDLTETTQRMRRRKVTSLLVTTPDGELLGALRVPREPDQSA